MAYLSRLKPYSLHSAQSPLSGSSGDVDIFTEKARRYRRSIRAMGGFWDATFQIPVGRDAQPYLLQRWFRDRMGWRVTERVGGVATWQGVIWEMELSLNGSRQRRSLGDMFNAVKTIYIDHDGNNQETSWYINDISISKFARRELILSLDGVSTTEAQTAAQSELARLSDAWVRSVSFNEKDEALHVTAVGEIFTANNRYVTAGDGSTGNVSTYIAEIIAADCDYLSTGTIATNTLQVKKAFPQPIRAWDALLSLTELGDGTDPYIIWVDAGGLVHYGPINPAPRFEWRGRESGLVSLVGDRNPWRARPGVIRDKTEPDGTAVPGSFLQQSNDAWLAEIEMADGQDNVTPKVETFDPQAIQQAVVQAERWLEQEAQDRG